MSDVTSPEWNFKFEQDKRFLGEAIYAGLRNVNTGFDSERIVWFSPEDFLIVIDRCESRHVRVIGIEVATTDVEPPWKAMLLEVEISPEKGYDWARRLAATYQEEPNIAISATFGVP